MSPWSHPPQFCHCKNNDEIPKFNGASTHCRSDMGVVGTRGEKTQAVRARQSIIEVFKTMSVGARRNQLLGQTCKVHILVTWAHK